MRPTTNVVADLAVRIRRDIALGVLAPGERLNIEALKRDFKVSHPSVREALALLTGQGYVVSEENKGYRVQPTSWNDLHDTTRIRSELESMGLQWSVEKSDRDWRAGVVAAHYALSEVEAGLADAPFDHAIEWEERNRAFHLALIGNCGSPRLIEMVSSLYDLTERRRLQTFCKTGEDLLAWLEVSSSEHLGLKDLAIAGDAASACELLKHHANKPVDEDLPVGAQLKASQSLKNTYLNLVSKT